MKILITGANGLLGQHLVKLLINEADNAIIAVGKGKSRLPFIANNQFTYHSLDITDGMAAVNFYLEKKPDIIIHAAAMTQVDECESDKIKCWNVNVTATRFLVEAAKTLNAYIVFVSTDFVFDGDNGPYQETDKPSPVNYYGSSKLEGEEEVMSSGLNAAVIRTCLVYGNNFNGNKSNIVNWVKDNLEQGKNIKVVCDQWRTPTYAEDLARGISLVIKKKVTGIYHISGSEMMTPYDMAISTAEYLHLNKSLIEKADASVFAQPAKRPPKTGLIIEKAKRELGYKPISFKENLQKMLG